MNSIPRKALALHDSIFKDGIYFEKKRQEERANRFITGEGRANRFITGSLNDSNDGGNRVNRYIPGFINDGFYPLEEHRISKVRFEDTIPGFTHHGLYPLDGIPEERQYYPSEDQYYPRIPFRSKVTAKAKKTRTDETREERIAFWRKIEQSRQLFCDIKRKEGMEAALKVFKDKPGLSDLLTTLTTKYGDELCNVTKKPKIKKLKKK